MSRPPARRPQLHRFPMGHLKVNIDCPTCGTYLGRCDSLETREIALRSHAAQCTARDVNGGKR